jgi:hypothetical protein
MKLGIRRSLAAITTAGALTLAGGLSASSAQASSAAPHEITTASVTLHPRSPDLGACYMHWIDVNGNPLTYATFTCLLTADETWRGYVVCTDGSTNVGVPHVGTGQDLIRCPSGTVTRADVLFS